MILNVKSKICPIDTGFFEGTAGLEGGSENGTMR
jgi:hypothetical protein